MESIMSITSKWGHIVGESVGCEIRALVGGGVRGIGIAGKSLR